MTKRKQISANADAKNEEGLSSILWQVLGNQVDYVARAPLWGKLDTFAVARIRVQVRVGLRGL